MTQAIADLLDSLSERGVRVRMENEHLVFQCSRGAVLPGELDELRRRKNEITALLKHRALEIESSIRPRENYFRTPLLEVQTNVFNEMKKLRIERNARFCTVGVRVLGELNTRLLERSIAAVVQRHDSLRTRIIELDGVPEQHIDTTCDFDFEIVECCKHSNADSEHDLRLSAEAFADEEISLSVGPLFAARLFRVSNGEHVLVLLLDHMIADGVSLSILSRDVWTSYRQVVHDAPFSLPHLPIQLPDYAVWQKNTRAAWFRDHGAYWRERLGGAPRMQLPFDNCAAVSADQRGAILEVDFGNSLSVRLRDMALREKTLPALLMLSIYIAVMSRWCSQRDLVVTFVENGRWCPELENVIGWLSNHLHLRIEVGQDVSCVDLIKQVHLEFCSAHDHQDFHRVPQMIAEYSMGLYFNWLSTSCDQWRLNQLLLPSEEIQLQPFEVTRREKWLFEFGTFFSEAGSRIAATLLYRADLFERSTIERFGRNLRSFAEELIRQPSGNVASVPLEMC